MTDMVNHPSHYTHGSIECIDVVENTSFSIGNAVKYVYRRNHKNSLVQDLQKAVWYLEREASRWEANPKTGGISLETGLAIAGLNILTEEESDAKIKSFYIWVASALYYNDPKHLRKAAQVLQK